LNPGTCFQGELTSRGVLQEIANGRLLRQRYTTETSLLPPEATAALPLMYLRVDDVPRVVLSAEALLLGLYPANSSAAGCDTPPWPLALMDIGLENLFPNPTLCPILNTLQAAWANSSAQKAHVARVSAPLDKQVSALLKVPPQYVTPNAVGDCFIANACNDKRFPAGVTQTIYDAVVRDYTYTYGAMMNWTSPRGALWAQLAVGSLLADVLDELDAALSGQTPTRLALFAGHDTTIAPLLRAFGMWDHVWPPYGSMLRLEVLQSTGGALSVRWLYQLDERELVMPACGQSPCPYQRFRAIAQGFVDAARTECPLPR